MTTDTGRLLELEQTLERETEAIKALRKVSAGKFDAAQATVFSSLWGRHGDLQRAVTALRARAASATGEGL